MIFYVHFAPNFQNQLYETQTLDLLYLVLCTALLQSIEQQSSHVSTFGVNLRNFYIDLRYAFEPKSNVSIWIVPKMSDQFWLVSGLVLRYVQAFFNSYFVLCITAILWVKSIQRLFYKKICKIKLFYDF